MVVIFHEVVDLPFAILQLKIDIRHKDNTKFHIYPPLFVKSR